jgi:hypothetical protein
MTDTDKKKPTVHDLTVYLRESYFLTDVRKDYKFRNKTGYVLNEQTDLNDFIAELKFDFENSILPTLDKLNSLQNCVDKFGGITFWGENLKKVIAENKIFAQ